MHNAELHLRLREHHFDGVWISLQAIHADDEDIEDAAVLQVRQHRHPELRAFVGRGSQPQHVLLPFHIAADGNVNRAVLHPPVLPHLHDQGIQEDPG
jgi:hypothetical protein